MKELKRYKEELVAIALLSIVFMAVRWLGIHYWVDAGVLNSAGEVIPGQESKLPLQYDMRSQTESMCWTVLRMVFFSLCAWGGVRITMPDAYKWIKSQFEFRTLTGDQKLSLVLRWFTVFFFGLVALQMSAANSDVRQCVIASASADLHVRELTGNNDGPQIVAYQRHVGAPMKSSYCVAFVSYHLSKCGVSNPRSGWSPAYAAQGVRVWTPRKAIRTPLPADVFTLYYPKLGRVGHGGFVKAVQGRFIVTLEANTNGGGSRNGDGVYVRKRELSKVYAITSYIKEEDRHRGGTRTGSVRARRLQTQTAARADHEQRKHGVQRERRNTARHDTASTRRTRGGHSALATAWHGHAAGHGALGQSVERSGGIQRPHQAQRRLRYHIARGTAVGHMDAKSQRAHGSPRAGAHRTSGSAIHAEVGVVDAAARYRWCRKTAVAVRGQAPQVPQTPVLV